jgi:polyisoprenoid-binding protein YceI
MPTAIQQISRGTYALDAVHSTVGFAVRHVVGTFRGTFADYDVRLEVDGEGELALAGVAKVPSVQVSEEALAGHLQSPDFFDAERTPEIAFRSSSVRLGDDGSLVVDGELTIKGTTRPVEARGSLSHVEADLSGAERVGIELETVVDRTAFGLRWNAPLPKGGNVLANDVKLTVSLELVKDGE